MNLKNVVLTGLFVMAFTLEAKADFWGGDLPLLAEIVANTLATLRELEQQTSEWDDEMAGIKDRIDRVRTIERIVEPSAWNEWKEPKDAVRRLQQIYFTLPPEYRTEKYDTINREITDAMNLVSRLQPEAKTSFESGKELERRGADASPGVAAKLSASGTGSLLTVQSQSLALQSHIASMLAQSLASGNEKETRSVASKGSAFKILSSGLSSKESSFSSIVLKREVK